MKKSILLAIALFLAVPAAILAQDTSSDNAFGIGPRIGYYQAEDANEGQFYFGGQMRLRFSRIVGFEAALEYRTSADYSYPDGTDVTVSQVPITGSLMLFVPLDAGVRPYGLGGLGLYYQNYDCDGGLVGCSDDSDFNMGYHLGFGLELAANDNISLSGDYRYLFLNPDQNENNVEDASFSGSVFSLALTFNL
ncbi:MAG: outer membrane beta-barrel protein [Balneolaceae bacterium]|nr:outer membrane beta-barrel protein [Balneolaceae bacterium]